MMTGKSKGLEICYITAYISQTPDQQQVATDITLLSTVCINGPLDHRAASSHTKACTSQPLSKLTLCKLLLIIHVT